MQHLRDNLNKLSSAELNASVLRIMRRLVDLATGKERPAMQQRLNQLGASVMVLEVMSLTDSSALQVEAVRLGIALLEQHGNGAAVQEEMLQHLTNGSDLPFFKGLDGQIMAFTKKVRRDKKRLKMLKVKAASESADLVD